MLCARPLLFRCNIWQLLGTKFCSFFFFFLFVQKKKKIALIVFCCNFLHIENFFLFLFFCFFRARREQYLALQPMFLCNSNCCRLDKMYKPGNMGADIVAACGLSSKGESNTTALWWWRASCKESGSGSIQGCIFACFSCSHLAVIYYDFRYTFWNFLYIDSSYDNVTSCFARLI